MPSPTHTPFAHTSLIHVHNQTCIQRLTNKQIRHNHIEVSTTFPSVSESSIGFTDGSITATLSKYCRSVPHSTSQAGTCQNSQQTTRSQIACVQANIDQTTQPNLQAHSHSETVTVVSDSLAFSRRCRTSFITSSCTRRLLFAGCTRPVSVL